MPPAIDPAMRQALAERLRFYRDLGLTDFYRRPVEFAQLDLTPPDLAFVNTAEPGEADLPSATLSRGPSSRLVSGERVGDHHPQLAAPTLTQPNSPQTVSGAPSSRLVSGERVGDHEPQLAAPSLAQTNSPQEDFAIPARKSIPAAPAIGGAVAPVDRPAALLQIIEDIGNCTRCALHQGRHSIVFADGSPNARLMFVGEGPGADEDEQGLPFVGRAGQLLNNMISAMGLKREEVYIANIVKCRPPGNRTPEPDEANTCSQFLFRQIDVVRPQVLVALGATAATYLLGQRQPLAGLRGRVHAWRGSSLIVTYHPAYLLRDPRQKKEAWADLQIAMKELGLKAPSVKPAG